MKTKIFINCFIFICLNAYAQPNDSLNTISGIFDFKNPKYSSRLIAKLKKPALITLHRFGDASNLNSPVQVLINVDGNLLEEELTSGADTKYLSLGSETTACFFGKEISIFLKPQKYPKNRLVSGQFKNPILDEHELLSQSWTLATNSAESLHGIIVPLGIWEKEDIIRITFGSVEVESNHDRDDVLVMLYINNKPLDYKNGTPYIFSEGNSVDVTAKSISVGFHPSIDKTLRAKIRGTFSFLKHND